ncbi:16457_t:CDS:2, partial [Acaulospora colombiana]
ADWTSATSKGEIPLEIEGALLWELEAVARGDREGERYRPREKGRNNVVHAQTAKMINTH